MKLYVAGIDLRFSNLSLAKEIEYIIDSLSRIRSDADAALGQDAVVLVVLQEYALTPIAIPNHEKKKYLEQLDEAVKRFNDIILIPGTFSAYEKFSDMPDPKKRKQKILTNYFSNAKKSYYRNDKLFQDECLRVIHNSQAFKKSVCLQNSAYILSSDKRIPRVKHKKSFPFLEDERLPDQIKNLFYIGADDPIKKIILGDKKIDLGLIICREHLYLTNKIDEIKDNLPVIQVLISDYIPLIKDNLFGAINIHMDSQTHLTVQINDEHPKVNVIDQIKAVFYYIHPRGNARNEVQISHFKLPVAEPVTPQADTVSLSQTEDKKDALKTSNSEKTSSGIENSFFSLTLSSKAEKEPSPEKAVNENKEVVTELGGMKNSF